MKLDCNKITWKIEEAFRLGSPRSYKTRHFNTLQTNLLVLQIHQSSIVVRGIGGHRGNHARALVSLDGHHGQSVDGLAIPKGTRPSKTSGLC
jgi:hypothetical protein